MKSRIINDMPPKDRTNQIKEIQDLTQVENVAALVEHLTDNPDIPVEEMGENVRNAVLLALLTETARTNNPDSICELVDFLLEQRREAGIAKEVKEAVLSFIDEEWPSFQKDR